MQNKIPLNISKFIFIKYIRNFKLKNNISIRHVISVVNLLFEELIKDLKNNKKIKIHNFGTISLESTKPRFYHNVVFKKMMLSKKHKKLSFILDSKIKKKLCKYLNLDASLKDD